MFFIKYLAIAAIAVAIKAQECQEYPMDVIDDVNEVMLAKKSNTCVIFVWDGNVIFVAPEPDSQRLLKELGVPLGIVEILRETYDSSKPDDILTKLAKICSNRITFLVYFTAIIKTQQPKSQPTKLQPRKQQSTPISPIPESITNQIKDLIQSQNPITIVVWVRNREVQLVSADADADKWFDKFQLNPKQINTIYTTYNPGKPLYVIEKLNKYRETQSNFLVYFQEARPIGHKHIGLLVPESLLYDIDNLLLVEKVKTVVIFVCNGKVMFAATEQDAANRAAQLGFSPDELEIIKDTFESFNSFEILRKLTALRCNTDTFLMQFTELAGKQFPEFSHLINDISYVILVQKSPNCVIFVSAGRIMFLTSENKVAQKQKELGINIYGVEVLRYTFGPKNPFDILGKLLQIRSVRDTFLMRLTECEPDGSPGYIFPEQLINEINHIMLVRKSKTIAIYALDGIIEFVSTEVKAPEKLAQIDNVPAKLLRLKDTYEAVDPFDILAKLNRHLGKHSTFLIIFEEEPPGADLNEVNVLVNDISNVILQQNSRICVIYVSNGKIKFVASEKSAPTKTAEFKLSIQNVEIVWEYFEPLNPFDILGKLAKIRTERNTFLVYFIERFYRPPVAAQVPVLRPIVYSVTQPVFQAVLQPVVAVQPAFAVPNLDLPFYQYPYFGFQFPQITPNETVEVQATETTTNNIINNNNNRRIGIIGLLLKASEAVINKGITLVTKVFNFKFRAKKEIIKKILFR